MREGGESVAVILVAIIVGVAVLFASSSKAQQRPVPANEGPNCMPAHELKADAQVVRIMQDADGDWWATIRFTSTGRILIGFLSRANGKFCVQAEGRTSPES